MDEQIAWYNLSYRWWCVKTWSRRVPDRVRWRVAYLVPRRLALFIFVRVYSAWGECGPDYEPVYKGWEVGKGR